MSVKVSIIVPVYNSAKTLRRCADSILIKILLIMNFFLLTMEAPMILVRSAMNMPPLITVSMSFTKITAVYLIQEIQLLIWLTENTYNF